jgi:mono/diheme cytochrome c family protein
MTKVTSVVLGVVATIVLAAEAGHFLASAQGRGGGRGAPAGAPADPTKIAVEVKVHDMKRLQSEPIPPDNVYRGRALWLERCAFCHDGVGQPTYKTMGPWLGAETVQTVGETSLRAIINAGTPRMPGYRYTLKPEQLDDLFAFLKTVGPETKPTPAQLAGTPPERSNTGE